MNDPRCHSFATLAPDAPAGRFVAAACGALTQRWQRDGRRGAVLPRIRVALNYSVCTRHTRAWVTLAVAECGGNTSSIIR